MKDADDVHANTIPKYREIPKENANITPDPKEYELNIGDTITHAGKRYKFLESKHLDVQHKRKPHIVLLGPAE